MRRPAAPQLRAGRPGAGTAPTTPATTAVPPAAAPAPAQASVPAPAVSAPTPAPAPATPSSPAAPRGGRAGRRALLLGGAAAVVGGAVGAGALLHRPEGAVPSASSLAGAAGSGGANAPFADVAADDPAAEAMLWAHETGVQPALSTTDYSPRATISRSDVALALHRLAGAPAVDLSAVPMLFTDLGEDPARVAAVLWVHGCGALWGDAELRVRPDEPATRDCAAMMLAALMRPALAGAGVTWDASAEASLPQAEDPGSALAEVAWLEAAGMAPSVLSLAEWSGEEGVSRADLAMSLHRANTVITDALG